MKPSLPLVLISTVLAIVVSLITVSSAFVTRSAFDEYKEGMLHVLKGIEGDGKETKEAVKELNRKVDRLLEQRRAG